MSRRIEITGIILGILLLIGMHFAAFLLICVIVGIISIMPTPIGNSISKSYLWLTLIILPFIGIGLFQILYVIPVVLWLKRRQEWGLMKGVIIGAVLTALLNGGCWLLVYSGSR